MRRRKINLITHCTSSFHAELYERNMSGRGPSFLPSFLRSLLSLRHPATRNHTHTHTHTHTNAHDAVRPSPRYTRSFCAKSGLRFRPITSTRPLHAKTISTVRWRLASHSCLGEGIVRFARRNFTSLPSFTRRHGTYEADGT